jgi:hypothetical protein
LTFKDSSIEVDFHLGCYYTKKEIELQQKTSKKAGRYGNLPALNCCPA